MHNKNHLPYSHIEPLYVGGHVQIDGAD
jgi:hypothetical protein